MAGDAAEVWVLVQKALEHYAEGRIDTAIAQLELAIRRNPDDRALARMLDWLRLPVQEPPGISVAPLQTGDTLDDVILLVVEPEEAERDLETPSIVQELAIVADAFDEHARPQVTPVLALEPISPVGPARPLLQDVGAVAPVPELESAAIEMTAEPTHSKVSLTELAARAPRRTSDRMAPHDEFRNTPSRNSSASGTLLGLTSPSLLSSMIDDPQPSTPRGTQMMHRVFPEDPSGVRILPEVAAATPSVRRSPSDRQTNPHLRRSPGDVAQAFLDLKMALKVSAALEAFELAERAIDMAGSRDLTTEQQQLVVQAYELAIGPLDQPVRHGAAPAMLDPRTAFMLSRIDGLMSVDELLEISGMSRFDALRLLAQLVRQGVVEF